ncbi:g10239 [Coccomyxa elongata]
MLDYKVLTDSKPPEKEMVCTRTRACLSSSEHRRAVAIRAIETVLLTVLVDNQERGQDPSLNQRTSLYRVDNRTARGRPHCHKLGGQQHMVT